MSNKDSYAIVIGSFMLLFASGLPLTSVFVFVPYFVLLITYFRVFKKTQSPRITSHGKAVFITGCDTGFGNRLASTLAESGFTVFAGCLKPDQNGAKELMLHAPKGSMRVLECDVTKDDIMQKCFEDVKNNLGDNRLWAVVNNAGVAQCCFVEWSSLDLYKLHHEVNVLGAVRTTKLFLPLLRHKGSRIINVGSIAGRVALAGFSAYTMSKFALRAFSDTLRREVSRFGVKVITIEPGLYRTGICYEEGQRGGIERQWRQTSETVRQAYGDNFLNGFLQAVSRTISFARANTDEVLNVLTHAISCSEPDRDYCPHWLTRLRICIMHLLPLGAEDWLMTKTSPTSRIEEYM